VDYELYEIDEIEIAEGTEQGTSRESVHCKRAEKKEQFQRSLNITVLNRWIVISRWQEWADEVEQVEIDNGK
jgi:hypothetical protein